MIRIDTYNFEGPYPSTRYIYDRAGIYAVLSRSLLSYRVLDVGESANLRTRLENHDRSTCWARHKQGSIEFAVLYTPGMSQRGRMQIEQQIRNKFDPPCGDR
jgi:hypothetical protein